MCHRHTAVSAIILQNCFHTIELTVLLFVFQQIKHTFHKIINIKQFQFSTAVVDREWLIIDEIAKMQTKAVIRAAINVQKAHADWTIVPEIMIPLIGDIKELKYVKKVVVETADAEIAASGIELKYEVGTMIEIPRAALTADEIANEADFFCFGTNDLTQLTFGFSRDDAGKFLDAYYDAKIFENDPFAKIDQKGVGKLMETAIKLGKPVNPKLHIGICGEHGGDPSSVEFCHKIGLDYVSCSPFRVPIARLAAAQAKINEEN